jgi:hypothetical protein
MDYPHVDIRLPVEITDMIIDFLFDDIHTLAAMSLVCKAFLPSTRKHLFNTVTLVLDYPCSGDAAVARLSKLAQIAVPLAPIVHHLDIVNSYQFDEPYDFGSFTEWIAAAMPLFAVLRGVTSLSTHTLSWDIKREVRNGVFSSFPHLLELSLDSDEFAESADIIDLVLQCPNIERLSLCDVYTRPFIATGSLSLEQSRARSLPKLKYLDMDGNRFNIQPIINWFCSLDIMPPLHTLRIADIISRECELIGQFVRALGPSLRHLTLMFAEGMLIHIICCTNLIP